MSASSLRITSKSSPFSFLQQRLQYIETAGERDWLNLIENVPRWPDSTTAPLAVTSAHLHEYAPAQGMAELLERLVAREVRVHGVAIGKENLVVTNGGLHGLSLIFRSLARQGAEAIVQSPVLGAVPEMLRASGYDITFLDTPNGTVDLEKLEASLTERTRLVYLNSPNNPAGTIIDAETMAALAELASRRRIHVVTDLVYDSYVFQGRAWSPLTTADAWDYLYAVNSMSKNFGAPGLRIGWVATSPTNAAAIAAVLERENISVSGLAQLQACALLDGGNEALVASVANGKQVIESALEGQQGIELGRPIGGSQFFAKLPVRDVEAFCDFALMKHDLGLVSASNYEGVEGPYVRLPMGARAGVLQRGLGRLVHALTHYAASAER